MAISQFHETRLERATLALLCASRETGMAMEGLRGPEQLPMVVDDMLSGGGEGSFA